MRILHTSDWHLGRSFHREGMLGAPGAFVDHLLEVVERERVDVVVVAGDIYDRALPHVDAVRLADETFARLAAVARPRGGHQRQPRLRPAARLRLPADRRRRGLHPHRRPRPSAPPSCSTTSTARSPSTALPYLDPDAAPRAVGAARPLPRGRARRGDAAGPRRPGDRATTRSVVLAHAFVAGAQPSRVRARHQRRRGQPWCPPASSTASTTSPSATCTAGTRSPTTSATAAPRSPTPSPRPTTSRARGWSTSAPHGVSAARVRRGAGAAPARPAARRARRRCSPTRRSPATSDDWVQVTLTDRAPGRRPMERLRTPLPAHAGARVRARRRGRRSTPPVARVTGRSRPRHRARLRRRAARRAGHRRRVRAAARRLRRLLRRPRPRRPACGEGRLMRLHPLSVTAFGPFADTVEVDFDTLSDAGLFLLSGPTGAGKTSVLDAVCFALYGDVPGDRSTAERLRSDQAGPALAPAGAPRGDPVRPPVPHRALAGVGAAQEARHRHDHRAGLGRRSASGVDGEWAALSTRLDETGHLVTGLLGMTLDPVLPGGDAAAGPVPGVPAGALRGAARAAPAGSSAPAASTGSSAGCATAGSRCARELARARTTASPTCSAVQRGRRRRRSRRRGTSPTSEAAAAASPVARPRDVLRQTSTRRRRRDQAAAGRDDRGPRHRRSRPGGMAAQPGQAARCLRDLEALDDGGARPRRATPALDAAAARRGRSHRCSTSPTQPPRRPRWPLATRPRSAAHLATHLAL